MTVRVFLSALIMSCFCVKYRPSCVHSHVMESFISVPSLSSSTHLCRGSMSSVARLWLVVDWVLTGTTTNHCTLLHCVWKNVPPFTCYNLHVHGSIATIFGTNVAEKAGNQNVLYFPTSPNYTVSQKTSHLWLALTLMHVNGFWYFLAEMLPIKQAIKRRFTMPPPITCASALPVKTGKWESHFSLSWIVLHTQCACALSSWKKKLSSVMCLIASNTCWDSKISH